MGLLHEQPRAHRLRGTRERSCDSGHLPVCPWRWRAC